MKTISQQFKKGLNKEYEKSMGPNENRSIIAMRNQTKGHCNEYISKYRQNRFFALIPETSAFRTFVKL